MEDDNEKLLEKPRGRRCFACGTENPIGLKLNFYRMGDTVRSNVELGIYHEGWQNMAHGGIISTLLDETMSWAVMYFKKALFVTRKMELKYIKPVFTGVSLIVSAKIDSETKWPIIRAKGEIRDSVGGLLVRSVGEFVALSPEQLASFPEDEKQEMLSLVARF
ncbi:MAG: PaaI family thioesterase [Desulfobacteraceae bacterium]|jgi:acyl-coenzyme A thioesterase PaaI-like protein|nr:MAG: PaaI family thioesterase [Desulfobacteraceae bacterium]